MITQAIANLNPDLSFTFSGEIETEEDYNKKMKWVVGKDKTDAAVFGVPDSIPEWIDIKKEINRIHPLIKWKRAMKKSDLTLMPRHREHAITRIDKGIADNKEEQKRYDAKIALRATRPDVL